MSEIRHNTSLRLPVGKWQIWVLSKQADPEACTVTTRQVHSKIMLMTITWSLLWSPVKTFKFYIPTLLSTHMPLEVYLKEWTARLEG